MLRDNMHPGARGDTIRCRNCYSTSKELLHRVPLERRFGPEGMHSLEIFRCLDCNLVFSGLELDQQSGADLYGKEYFEAGDSVRAVDRTIVNESYKRALDKLAKLQLKGGKLLDVGCGYGEFLEFARSRGWEVDGVDISPWAAQVASQESGVPVFLGTLFEASYPSETFDVVTAWDLIEHLNEPRGFVAEVRRILKADGMLVVRTPNQDSLFHWLASMASRLGWSYPLQQLYHVDHLSYFTKSTLASLLGRENIMLEMVEYEDLTIRDLRFHGWKRATIGIVHLLAKVLRKHHALIAFARAVR